MDVKFHKPFCPKHQLPFQYLCTKHNCKCPARLCSRCKLQHPIKQDTQGQFTNQDTYSLKLRAQIQNLGNSYPYLQRYKGNKIQSNLLSNKNQENVKSIQAIQLALKKDKKKFLHSLQKFLDCHYAYKIKLNLKKAESNLDYLVNIRNNQLLPLLVKLSSDSGLQKLGKRVLAAQQGIQFYNDFLNQVQRYGHSTQQFLAGISCNPQTLFKNKLKNCLSHWSNTRKVEVNGNGLRQNRENRENTNASRKKIKVVSSHKRRLTDKQN